MKNTTTTNVNAGFNPEDLKKDMNDYIADVINERPTISFEEAFGLSMDETPKASKFRHLADAFKIGLKVFMKELKLSFMEKKNR